MIYLVNMNASDDTKHHRELAKENGKMLITELCDCSDVRSDEDIAYYRKENGSHGWMHYRCRKIMQNK